MRSGVEFGTRRIDVVRDPGSSSTFRSGMYPLLFFSLPTTKSPGLSLLIPLPVHDDFSLCRQDIRTIDEFFPTVLHK